MMEFLTNFHFLRPWLLLFLLLPLALYLKKVKFATTASSWEDICDKNLLDFLLVSNKKLKTLSIKKFVYTGLIFATLAAAGPSWEKEDVPAFTVENPNMFVISLAQDMQLKDVAPSRLERAKFMLSDITDNIIDGQFGIEVYSNEPYIITPITDDVRLVKSLLPQIVPDIVPDNGDRLDRAIDLAIERFSTAGYSSGNIILFASDVGQRFDLALEKAKLATKKNYHIYVVDTSYSGNEKLKLLAETGDGVYLSVQELSLDKLLQRINTINNERLTLTENQRSNYIDFGYYLVFIPLLCVLFLFRRGVLVLVFCLFASQADAGFLQNNNQEGLSFFQQGAYDKALEKFTDVNWRGVSLYKQEKLEDALNEFSKQPQDATSLYNKGVVLAKLCKYEDALKTFDEVLKINPQFDDAHYNRQVLTDLFEKAKENPEVLNCDNQQQQNQDSSQQEQNDKNQSDNQDNQQQNSDNKDNSEENSSDEQQNSDTDNQEDSQNQNSSGEQSSDKQQENKEQQSETGAQDEQSGEQNNNSSQEQSDESPSESDDKPAEANNDEGDEQQSNNQSGEEKNGDKEQPEEQNVSLANAKEGDKDDKYDEEALAMQRRYREIPEDTGGLLREFIKKEYMKDRYKNENM